MVVIWRAWNRLPSRLRARSEAGPPGSEGNVRLVLESSSEGELLCTPMTFTPPRELRAQRVGAKRKAGPSPIFPSGGEVGGGSAGPPRRGRRNRIRKVLYDPETAGLSAGEDVDVETPTAAPPVPVKTVRSTGPRASASGAVSEVGPPERDVFAGAPTAAGVREMEGSLLGGLGIDLLGEIEDIRRRSGRLQGKLSGRMKDCVELLRAIVETFVDRLETRGDPTFMGPENIELKARVRAAKRGADERRTEFEALEAEIRNVRSATRRSDGPVRTAKEVSTGYGLGKLSHANPSVGASLTSSRGKRGHMMGPALRPGPDSGSVPAGSGSDAAEARSSIRMECTKEVAELDRQMAELARLRSGIVKMSRELAAIESPRESPGGRLRRSRGRPRIVSDERLVPPMATPERDELIRPPLGDSDGWVEVSGRSRRPRAAGRVADGSGAVPLRAPSSGRPGRSGTRAGQTRGSTPRRGQPRSSAVTITGRTEGFSYAKALTEARVRIPLQDLDIEFSKIRRTVNGGRIIEIPGADSAKRADDLAARLREVFRDEARVARPVVRGELRIAGLDDSVTSEEVRSVIAREGKCSEEDVRTGPIRLLSNGLGSVWTQYPLVSTLAVSKLGKLRIGWTLAKVELLKSRPTQYYRCWHFGHVRFACKSTVDRSGLCFRCGTTGHAARNCQAALRCVVCADLGRECDHRMGSELCSVRAICGSRDGGTSVRPEVVSTRRVLPLDTNNGDKGAPM